jgi:hypothetical protein
MYFEYSSVLKLQSLRGYKSLYLCVGTMKGEIICLNLLMDFFKIESCLLVFAECKVFEIQNFFL